MDYNCNRCGNVKCKGYSRDKCSGRVPVTQPFRFVECISSIRIMNWPTTDKTLQMVGADV